MYVQMYILTCNVFFNMQASHNKKWVLILDRKNHKE